VNGYFESGRWGVVAQENPLSRSGCWIKEGWPSLTASVSGKGEARIEIRRDSSLNPRGRKEKSRKEEGN
jgi:hypothetical protein